ncbi:viral envelope protein [Kosakonia phage Kc263]|uniref:Viral envelope protein n=1 Tax=Kosakonia phage Kc263 TaxID=2863194 RepID=A0AAE7WHZ9_9CAUD|nr:viral envelope protein [Kosakonia phage Kc263]QYN79984.1 viral envelope protein [Kosakonia phage Kc263]
MSNEVNSLEHSLQGLILIDIRVDGAESLLTDIMGKLKEVGSNTGEMAVAKISEAARVAKTGIIKAIGTRRMFIAHLHNRLSKDAINDEMTFTAGLLKKVTRDGKPSDIIDGLDDLQKTMDELVKYLQDVQTHYSRELKSTEGIKGINTGDDAIAILDVLDTKKFPKVNFPQHSGNTATSTELPGGKFIRYDTTKGRFYLENEVVTASDVTESFAKEDVKSVLSKLNKLIETYQYVVKALDHYVEYVKKFNTVVGKSFAHLDALKGKISASLLNELHAHLEGNADVFALYTGFLPKVMIYLDDYVDTLSSYLSKQFN